MAEDMNQIFENADITRRDDDGELNTDRTTAEEQNKCKFAKELLRTVSSCFETPIWGMCTGTEPHVQCLMLNYKRMPDSIIAIVPENNVVDLRYPIVLQKFLARRIQKVLMKKSMMGSMLQCRVSFSHLTLIIVKS